MSEPLHRLIPAMLRQLQDADQSKHNLGDANLPLPACMNLRVATFGERQAGQSTIINRLFELPILPHLPNLSGTCCVVRVRFIKASTKNITVYIRSVDSSETRERSVVALEDCILHVHTLLNNIKSRAQEADRKVEVVADEEVIVELRDPCYHDVEFIELPGMANAQQDVNHTNIHDNIQRILAEDQNNTVYLAVLKGSSDLTMNNSPTAVLVEQYNLVDRTIGVITHVDKSNWDDEEEVDDLLVNNDDIQGPYPFTHGWVILTNRISKVLTKEQRKMSPEAICQYINQHPHFSVFNTTEDEYSAKMAPRSVEAGLTGVQNLRGLIAKALSSLLVLTYLP
jgi:hypothetical protein